MKPSQVLATLSLLAVFVATSAVNAVFLWKKVARHDHRFAIGGFLVTLALVVGTALALRRRRAVSATVLSVVLGHIAGIAGFGATILLDSPATRLTGSSDVATDSALLIWMVWPVFGLSWLSGLVATWALRQRQASSA